MSRLLSDKDQTASVVKGGAEAAFELGMAYSSGSAGMPLDLVQAHRWLNVAAICGYKPAQEWRAEIATEMSGGEVVEAQKLARATLQVVRAAA